MRVFAVPEAIQTEEGKCSEVFQDTDGTPEGKCALVEAPFLGDKICKVSYPHPKSALMFYLPWQVGSYCLGTFK